MESQRQPHHAHPAAAQRTFNRVTLTTEAFLKLLLFFRALEIFSASTLNCSSRALACFLAASRSNLDNWGAHSMRHGTRIQGCTMLPTHHFLRRLDVVQHDIHLLALLVHFLLQLLHLLLHLCVLGCLEQDLHVEHALSRLHLGIQSLTNAFCQLCGLVLAQQLSHTTRAHRGAVRATSPARLPQDWVAVPLRAARVVQESAC